MKKDEEGKDLSRRDFVKAAAIGLGGIGATALSARAASPQAGSTNNIPARWDKVADVVVIGSGAAGLPAALAAADEGASVIIVEQNYDIGGHAIQSGGAGPFGGGTTLQKKNGIDDSPEKFFSDFMSLPEFRFCDRDLIRAFVNNSAQTFEWLSAKGVQFRQAAPAWRDDFGPISDKRVTGASWSGAVNQTSPTGANGTALMRPLEAAAKKAGIEILLRHSFKGLIREGHLSGRVVGLAAEHQGAAVNIQARRGVVIATGGHTSNVNFRRIFDSRLTEEYQVVGEPYSYQTADGEIAALEIGASLWGTANQTLERYRIHAIEKPRVIGTRYGYQTGSETLKNSPIFHLMKAIGLRVKNYQNLIHVNQVGKRFVDETEAQIAWFNACLSINGGDSNGGGPIWAIFDSDGAKREGWTCAVPWVDPEGWFFTGNTLSELAANIKNKYQKKPIDGRTLEETVARYNSFVGMSKDPDFGKAAPTFKIEKPPFYAGWSTPCVHDCITGLRISPECQVMDLHGRTIDGLYCAGESAGGFNLHGVAKCMVQGRIAGRAAGRSDTTSSSKA